MAGLHHRERTSPNRQCNGLWNDGHVPLAWLTYLKETSTGDIIEAHDKIDAAKLRKYEIAQQCRKQMQLVFTASVFERRLL